MGFGHRGQLVAGGGEQAFDVAAPLEGVLQGARGVDGEPGQSC